MKVKGWVVSDKIAERSRNMRLKTSGLNPWETVITTR